jgi:hypothetical protein
LLRKAPAPDGSEAAFRDALAKLVLDQSTTRRITRGLPREVEPTDVQDPLALAHVERPTDTIPPVLAPAAQEAVDRIINERRQADLLARVGIEPTRKLLLTGAPGVGKTMTARYLAAELDLPLLTVDLAALMSSFLGRTGHNLRRILDYARSSPSVLLLDEFDALGKRRDDPSDVGELKRIVNVLLVELERWPSESLLIAATNHPELLDRAVWRRFDHVLSLALPTADVRADLLARTAVEHGYQIDESELQLCVVGTEGMSGSDLVDLVRDRARAAALSGHPGTNLHLANEILGRLLARSWEDEAARMRYAGLAHEYLGCSQREIGADLHVSHVTVGKLLKQWAAERTRLSSRLRTSVQGSGRNNKASRTDRATKVSSRSKLGPGESIP